MKSKRTVDVELKAIIPSGNKLNWSTFYADTFDVVWSDGKVGINKEYRIVPTEKEKQMILSNIKDSIEKLETYKTKLINAENILIEL